MQFRRRGRQRRAAGQAAGSFSAKGGGAGTSNAGGTGGATDSSDTSGGVAGSPGANGARGTGGDGGQTGDGSGSFKGTGGGGGGGGYYGGGGGGGSDWRAGGGGGGGSSYAPGGTVNVASTGTPSVTISAVAPSQISMSLAPASITANGTSTTTATATVTDSGGLGLPGEPVTFASDGNQQHGAISDHGDGTYTTTFTSTSTVGTARITATDGSLSNYATLAQTAGPPARIAVALAPSTVTADGSSTSVATATVFDANSNKISGDPVTFTSNGGQAIAAPTANSDGSYSSTITATTHSGSSTITARDANGVSGTATLTQSAGPPTGIALALQPASIVANGSSQSTATATVTDANGNGVAGRTVTFHSDGAQTIGSTTDKGNGTYTAPITATRTAGQATITASDGARTSSGSTLTQTAGPAANIAVALDPANLTADGASTSTATATLTDADGNAVAGETVAFSGTGGQSFSSVSYVGNGRYRTTLTAGTQVGRFTITARAANGATGGTSLAQMAACKTGGLVTFSYTGLDQCYKVPSGSGTVHVVATGAPGADANSASGNVTGGKGARVTTDLTATSGDSLYVEVGGGGARLEFGGQRRLQRRRTGR